MTVRRIALALIPLLFWASAAPPGLAQEATEEAAPAPVEPAAPQPYPLAEISIQAENTRKELREMNKRLAEVPDINLVEEKLEPTRADVKEATATTTRLIESDSASITGLDDLERQGQARQNEIKALRQRVTERAGSVDGEIARLGVLSERWKLTQKAADETGGATAVEWIDGSLKQIAETESEARKRAKSLVELQARVGDLEESIRSSLEAVQQEKISHRSQLFQSDAPPIWEGWLPEGSAEGVRERIREDWERDLASISRFADQRAGDILKFISMMLLVFLGTTLLRRKLDVWLEDDENLTRTAEVFRRPASVTLLVSLLASPYFFPLAPAVVFDLLALLLLVPAIRLLAPLVKPAMRPLLYGLAIFYLASEFRQLLDAAPVASRLLFTLEVIVAIGALSWLMRPARLSAIEPDDRPPAYIGAALRIFLAVLVLAFVVNLLGYFSFAKVLGRGILVTVYAALIARGTHQIAMIFLAVIMRTPLARRLRMVRLSGDRIQLWIGRFAGLLLFYMWFNASTGAFTIRDATFTALASLVGTSLPIGAVNLSLGDILVFGLVVASSVYLVRFIRFVLEEDVFPRIVMQRGVPNAVTTVINYVVLLLGFTLALGAAGFELSRVTLLAGAFGVGIGFGLQDVVNNFVSGLILLFERPIQVGDTIEIQGGLLGDVRRIGPRSSTIRTFDGAEVIVPNGMLISREVTNWTLSDRRRRLTVDIGVKYGTDPERVLAILNEVAAENETVLADPDPLSIFLGFGDSSLDFQLRCWIPRYEEGFGMRTMLRVAIYAKLNEAGIEIPFPQRDLHLRSVDGVAAKTLRGDGRD